MLYSEMPNPYEDKALLAEHMKCMYLTRFSYNPMPNFVVPPDYGKTISFQADSKPMLPIYFVVKNDAKKELWIVVRGSRSPNDIYSDVNGQVTDLYGSQSHKGFVQSGTNVYNALPWSDINFCIENNFKFVFTGHSLGGATAAVLCMMFKRTFNYTNLKCITFGCPGLVTPQLNSEWYPIIDSVFHIGDPIPFACLHNICANSFTGLSFVAALSKAIFKSGYFPLSFLGSKCRSDVSPQYDLLIPPGRLFPIGQTPNGELKIIEYKEYEYFDGLQVFLSQYCHLISFYTQSMDELSGASSEPQIQLPPVCIQPDFYPAFPLSQIQKIN